MDSPSQLLTFPRARVLLPSERREVAEEPSETPSKAAPQPQLRAPAEAAPAASTAADQPGSAVVVPKSARARFRMVLACGTAAALCLGAVVVTPLVVPHHSRRPAQELGVDASSQPARSIERMQPSNDAYFDGPAETDPSALAALYGHDPARDATTVAAAAKGEQPAGPIATAAPKESVQKTPQTSTQQVPSQRPSAAQDASPQPTGPISTPTASAVPAVLPPTPPSPPAAAATAAAKTPAAISSPVSTSTVVSGASAREGTGANAAEPLDRDLVNRTLDLVKILADHLQTLSKENRALQGEVEQMQKATNNRLDAMEQRLSLHDATEAVDALADPSGPGSPPALPRASVARRKPHHPETTAASDEQPANGALAEPVRRSQASRSALPHYTIQAAAPDFAIVTSATGNMELHPNDDLPGYGHVQSIALRGSSWVIMTDHGVVH